MPEMSKILQLLGFTSASFLVFSDKITYFYAIIIVNWHMTTKDVTMFSN